jgi:hypothetical protein
MNNNVYGNGNGVDNVTVTVTVKRWCGDNEIKIHKRKFLKYF